jgi:hypothetical protein
MPRSLPGNLEIVVDNIDNPTSIKDRKLPQHLMEADLEIVDAVDNPIQTRPRNPCGIICQKKKRKTYSIVGVGIAIALGSYFIFKKK